MNMSTIVFCLETVRLSHIIKALAIYNLIGWNDMANDVKDRNSVTTRHAANDGDALLESAKSVLQK